VEHPSIEYNHHISSGLNTVHPINHKSSAILHRDIIQVEDERLVPLAPIPMWRQEASWYVAAHEACHNVKVEELLDILWDGCRV